MMSIHLYRRFVFLFITCTFPIYSLFGQSRLAGEWAGVFMDDFNVVVHLSTVEGDALAGRIVTLNGGEIIQDDELDQFTFEAPSIKFFIPAKQTVFEGIFNEAYSKLSGSLLFPDGSRHVLELSKTSFEQAAAYDPLKALDQCMNLFISKEAGLDDLRFIYDMMVEHHPDPYAWITAEDFEAKFQDMALTLTDDLRPLDLYRLAASLTDAIGCSHTGVRLSNECLNALAKSGRDFPIHLYFENDRAYALRSACPNQLSVIPGAEVLAVNKMEIPEIRDKLLTFFPAEAGNTSTKRNSLNRQFNKLYFYIDQSDAFDVSFEDGTVSLAPCSSTEPADISDLNKEIKFVLMEGPDAAYLRIPTFGIRDLDAYFNQLEQIFHQVNESNTGHLIIDLRNNSGGHPIFAAQLISYLINKPFQYFKRNDEFPDFEPLYNEMQPNPLQYDGRLYVLVNGGCLSTTGHLISLLDYHTEAVFVGEMPGSTNKCNDFSMQLNLPNSPLVLNLPRAVFETAVSQAGQPFNLDYEVIPKATDIRDNVDPVLEHVKVLINASD